MVAKIVIGKSIRGILNYNERKVYGGEAQLILANGFACDVEKLTIPGKIQRFLHLTELKPTVKTNALHISLNFDATEKIDNQKMQQIAMSYMEQIGFGDQPYLVYRHNDVAHQHVHIATVSINRNGEAIKLHNIGRDKSEPARKAIEKDFNLIVAESRKFKAESAIKPVDAEKVNYGHLPTKRSISNVVTAVTNSYAFTSLAEYNVILNQFNVLAERGVEGTEMYKNKGLVYSLLNKKGEKSGVPIKASAFYSKPTLHNLEKHFLKSEEKRKLLKPDLIARIDKVFSKYEHITKKTLVSELNKLGINLVFRQNEQGVTYGATYVDNLNKTVFNGSDLGKAYSAKGILDRLSNSDTSKTYLKPINSQGSYLPQVAAGTAKTYLNQPAFTNFLETVLGKPQNDQGTGLPKRKKKRRRGFRI